MAVVCPTVTAFDPHEYRAQMELVASFAERIHIDLMDGKFAPTVSPPLSTVWWPQELIADIHVMYQQPAPYLDQLLKLKPHLVIIHAEAEVDHASFAAGLHAAGIKAGLGVLQKTAIAEVAALLDHFDHIMIFSGNLGHHGSTADLELLGKVREARRLYPDIEIAWDGGIDDRNAKPLAEGGVDVLNVGGFIHKADSPPAAYALLQQSLKG